MLLLPIGSAAKIDTQNTPSEAAFPNVFAKKQGSFSTINPFERFKLFKKGQNTEGGYKKEVNKKNTLAKRIFTILLLVVIGVLLVYYLQGNIGLALVTLGIFSYWRNRHRLNNWERRRYERIHEPDSPSNRGANKERNKDVVTHPNDMGMSKKSLSHSSNKLTRRAFIRFFSGLGLLTLGLISIFINAFSAGGSITFAILIFLLGYVLAILGYVNAIQAVSAKEPQSALAWLVIILGSLLVFSLLRGSLFFG
jgi:heme-degrading monooxygenase HmoA